MDVKSKLQKIDPDHFQLLTDIGNVAKKEHLKVYLVGGMVRDLLLGFDNLDIDITVENNSLVLADALVKAFPNCKLGAKHDRFHTAKLLFDVKGKTIPVDLASTREEIYKHPAALPDVRVSELNKDLIRRDFTINALAVSLLPDDFGEVVDLFNGLEDLQRKEIRILHDKSFIDDPTRMIRAIRFAEKLSFKIEDKTNKLLHEAISSGQFDNLIEKIRGDRVKIEIRYLFNLPDVAKAINAFFDSEIYKMISTQLNTQSSILSSQPSQKQWLIVLALLLKDLDDKQRTKTMSDLQLIGDETKIIQRGYQVYSNLNSLISHNQPVDSLIIYRELKNLSTETVELLRMLFVSNKSLVNLIDEFVNETSKIQLEITGDDLKSLGLSEGKIIGKVIQTVLEKKIKNPSMTKSEELKVAKEFKD